MLENHEIAKNYTIDSNIQNNHYKLYNQIYNSKKRLLSSYLIADSIIKIGGVLNELVILNIIRENLLNELSDTNVIEINIRLFAILILINGDKEALNTINNIKQELVLIKQKTKTIKKLSKTKNYIG